MLDVVASLHPFFVHFPVALLVVGAGIACVDWLRRRASSSTSTSSSGAHPAWIASAAVFALLAVGSGLAAAAQTGATGTEADQIELHRWLGIGTAVLAVVAAVVERLAARATAAAVLIVAGLTALATGFVGGDIAHGWWQDPESAAASEVTEAVARTRSLNVVEVAPDASAEELAVHARRILKRRCVKCHRASKIKGELRLDTREHAMRGGESGPVIIPGDRLKSPLYTRPALPPDDEHVMPKKGRLLSFSEIEVIGRWIDAGAVWTDPPAEDPLAATPDQEEPN